MEVSGRLHVHPSSYTLGVKAPGTYWTGGWIGLSAGLDAVAKRKKPHSCTFQELSHGQYEETGVCEVVKRGGGWNMLRIVFCGGF
jgi:hypothetical protein